MQTFSDKIRLKKELDSQTLTASAMKVYKPISDRDMRCVTAAGDPCAAEISRVLEYFRIDIPEIPPEIEGIENMIQFVMNETGLTRRKVVLTGKWWREGAAPLICEKDGAPIALIPDSRGGYVFYNDGKEIRVNRKNSVLFDINCCCFYAPLKNGRMTMKDFAKCLCGSFSISDAVWLLAVSLLAGLLGMVLPYINRFVFHSVVPSGTSKELNGIMVLITGTVIIQALCNLARSLWVMRIGNKMELLSQNAVWARLLSLPAGFFKGYSSGELSQRAEAVNRICEILGGQLIPTVLGSMFSFIYLFQISSISHELFLPSLIIVLLMLGVQLGSAFLQINQTRHNNRIQNKLTGTVFELLNGLTKIKASGAEARAFGRWADQYSKLKNMPNVFVTLADSLSGAISFGGTIFLYFTAFSSDMSASDYIAFNTAFSLFTSAVLSLAGISTDIASLKPSLEMIKPIIEEAPENTGYKKQVTKLSGAVDIDQLKFRYSDDMPYVLNGLNLHIKAGEYIGIVGSSGCGKSTLMRVLLGFEKPQSGSVYYDMQDMDGMDLRSMRRRIGVVLQNGKLFSGDIYSNIVICAPWLSVEDAWAAAEKSGFADDIRNMPMGMFTMISEGGGGLSGGQQQRLLIARALASAPDIIMFDEATSALDNITQSLVVKTLEEMSCTRIVIAHRLSTIKGCSRIIYLDKGRVAEEGTFDELMALNGKFAELASRQIV